MTTYTCTLSDELLDRCGALIYREWSTAFDALKHVKAETNDGSMDWSSFHQHRLTHAQSEFDKYTRLLNEIKPHTPLVRSTKELFK